MTIHYPAPRCDSLNGKAATIMSEKKRGCWQLKTESRSVYIVEKKNTTPIPAVVNNKKVL